MLDDASLSVTAAAGTAVTEAVGTEAWPAVRAAAARLLSRGTPGDVRTHLARLDRDMTALLEQHDERLRIRLESAWQTRFEVLLDGTADSERTELLARLQDLALLGQGRYALAARPGLSPAAPAAPVPPSPAPSCPPPSSPLSTDAPDPDGTVHAPVLVGKLPTVAGPFRDRSDAGLPDGLWDGPSPTWALVGPPGVGKTRLAAHLARRVLRDGAADLVVWMTATSEDAVVCGYAEAAEAVTGHGSAQPEHAAEAFRSWLSWTDRRWLVVLDGLPGTAELHHLWPPERPNGRVLVTTGHAGSLPDGSSRLDLGPWDERAAAEQLTRELAELGRTDDPAHIAALAADLRQHPLALSTAAADLAFTGRSCAAYRTALREVRQEPAPSSTDAARAEAGGGAGPDLVTACWWLSIGTADRHAAGLARPLLELAAVLDPHGAPVAVLTSAPALQHLARRRSPSPGDSPQIASPDAPTALDALTALDVLHRLRLVERGGDAEHPTVRLSTLVQSTVRAAVPAEDRDALALSAADALRAVWRTASGAPRSPLCRALRSCTDVLAGHAREALWQPQCHPVLFQAGRNLIAAGMVRAARVRWEWLHAALHHRFGPDHPDTLAARGHRARVRGASQDAPGAVTAYRELLDDLVRVLGPDHPDVFTVRDNLALWQGVAGDPARAAAAYTDLLADRLRVLGPDHRDTLLTRHNIALWRGTAGDAAGAAAAYAELLDDMGRVFGVNDPAVLDTRDRLTEWRNRAADAAAAARAPMSPVREPAHPEPPDPGFWAPPAHSTAPGPDGAGPVAVPALSAERLLLEPSWARRLRLRLTRRGPETRGRRSGADVLRAPLAGCHRIAVISLKGGTGKTTTAAALGATLAGLRDDPVIAVDASPEGGTLGHRVGRESGSTVLDLLAALPDLQDPEDVRAFTARGPEGLEVLAQDVAPGLSAPFGIQQYQRLVDALSRAYPIIVTDSGTGLLHEAVRGVLALADQVVVVATASVDGAEVASVTLDWLSAHGHAELARRALVVLSGVHAGSSLVRTDRIVEHFAQRCRGVVRVPFDEHLATGAGLDLTHLRPETRRAYLDLAIQVAECFRGPHPIAANALDPLPPSPVSGPSRVSGRSSVSGSGPVSGRSSVSGSGPVSGRSS
ncbi:hypothetical protein ABZZ16_16970, partial [Streptomyces sp. NPDC006386]|uniref:nucleotide-binding protein n=1 Tax=Streptomyces sp. NPDC006386 TaxID=3156762 RepID=UPI0033BA9D0A